MSLIITLAGVAIRSISAARKAAQAGGHESATLNEMHDGLTPVRGALAKGRAQEASAGSSTSDPTEAPDADGDFWSEIWELVRPDWF